MADECAYPGCSNPKDDKVVDGMAWALEKLIEVERDGELDFPNPPWHANSSLCKACWKHREESGNAAMAAARVAQDSETVRMWREDLRRLMADSSNETWGEAALHGYQEHVRRMIRTPKA
ncbi:MAG: hypothetical protein O7H41_10180 [Planctomycetota bacterium]|nr:hypothetical protein [Planctomycetota bacterium]